MIILNVNAEQLQVEIEADTSILQHEMNKHVSQVQSYSSAAGIESFGRPGEPRSLEITASCLWIRRRTMSELSDTRAGPSIDITGRTSGRRSCAILH
jgi:hypothetical protein